MVPNLKGRNSLQNMWLQGELDDLTVQVPSDLLPVDLTKETLIDAQNHNLLICICPICCDIMRRPMKMNPCEDTFYLSIAILYQILV